MKNAEKARLACFHGGDLADAKALRIDDGSAPKDWVDLSTGINPFTYPVPDVAPEIWNRLPSRDKLDELMEAARQTYGATQDVACVVAPGSQALIQMVPQLVPKSDVAIISPTYQEHGLCWGATGHKVREIASIDEVEDTDQAVIITRPNNPGGDVLPLHALLSLAEDLAQRDGLLVLDEAFADGLDISIVPHLADDAFAKTNILILRSLGKFYGLAGARMGFGFGQGELMEKLAARLGPWPVAGPSIEAGIAALNDNAWREEMTDKLETQRDKLRALLAQIGVVCEGEALLFQTVKTPLADELFQHLLTHYIYVRRFHYDRELLRFGLPGPAEDAWQLEDGLKAFAAEHKLEPVAP